MQKREKQKERNKWGLSTVEIMQTHILQIKYQLYIYTLKIFTSIKIFERSYFFRAFKI